MENLFLSCTILLAKNDYPNELVWWRKENMCLTGAKLVRISYLGV